MRILRLHDMFKVRKSFPQFFNSIHQKNWKVPIQASIAHFFVIVPLLTIVEPSLDTK